MNSLLVSAFILLGTALSAHGFSAGPPQGACNSRVPNHDQFNPSSGHNYNIAVPRSAPAGQLIKVTIHGGSFLGYMIQGVDANNITVGHFVGTTKRLSCNNPDDTAVHSARNGNPMQSVDLDYVLPVDASSIRFRATVVESYKIFYTDIFSSFVQIL